MDEYSECWSCKHYFIGADLDDFLAGVEECDLELPMHSNTCNEYVTEILNIARLPEKVKTQKSFRYTLLYM